MGRAMSVRMAGLLDVGAYDLALGTSLSVERASALKAGDKEAAR
jgi:hypothetical protein